MHAVQGTKVEVYMDGGVRKGTDVFKALALGAKAVFLGRPILWGLAYQVSTGNLWRNVISTNKKFIVSAIVCIASFYLYVPERPKIV